ncbi:MAG: GDP-fucose synthetase [Opitutae bacterium]|nr:GDP-fucose synthetase [Opitutae bacterium]|tara:strand:- start:685 stop:1626 length:942 start_codon:yes stop_codon:yes gene_type:complete
MSQRIYVAGHQGMVGSSVLRNLQFSKEVEIITRSRAELDLCEGSAVDQFFASEKPDVVIMAAARVGGIHANDTYSAEFIYENLAISMNVTHAAWRHGCSRLLNLGSSCIYPREATQPMSEKALLSGSLEPTNEAYAVAKIAALKLCSHYRKQYDVLFHSAMPTNLYGTGDNYHSENSHVLPALLRRMHEAKQQNDSEVVIWGTGNPMREFMHVDDLASACLHLLKLEDPPDWVNVGSGMEVSIRELAEKIKHTLGYEGELIFDSTKPDGSPRKLMDSSLLRSTGWEAQISLDEGLLATYADFQRELAKGTLRN